MTAKTRLLAADLTTPGLLDTALIPTICFTDAINSPSVKETRLRSDVYAQVLDVENLSRSRWDQIEELEAIDRGEQTRGREIVRLPVHANLDSDDPPSAIRETTAALDPTAVAVRNATHRLLLQDCRGQKVYGLELVRIPEIAVGMLPIGAKILLKKGTVVARGAILLEPDNCQMLGGKIEAWQRSWLDGRLARLRDAAGVGGED